MGNQVVRHCLAGIMLGALCSLYAEAPQNLYYEGFENVPMHGAINEHAAIVKHAGFNGSAGLRITPGSTKYQYKFPLRFKPQKGRRYIFTIYEKLHGAVGSHVAWEAYKNNAHQFGNWNVKRTKDEGGWTKCEIPLYIKGDHEVSGKEWEFTYFVFATPKEKQGNNAYVDYDNLSIREDNPVWHLAMVWPTHNKINAQTGKIRLFSAFDGSFLKPHAQPVYRLELSAGDKTLAKQELKDQNGVLKANLGKLTYRGPAILKMTQFDRKRQEVAAVKTLEVTVADPYIPKPGEIVIDEKGRAIVDGKPFMPLGFFSSFGRIRDMEHAREHLKWMHDAGFNIIMEYWITAWGKQLGDFMDLLHKNHIRLLYNFSGVVHHPERIHKQYKQEAIRMMNYPATLGWYTMDEAHAGQLPAIVTIRKMLNELSPGYVTWSYNIFDVPAFLNAVDMPGGGTYPIGWAADLTASDQKLAAAEKCLTGLWYAPQSMNNANYVRGAWESQEAYRKAGKEPTENEFLSVALLQASHGVTGFIFYSYHDLLKSKVPEWVAPRREAIRKVAKTLRSLEPFIMSGEKIDVIPVTNLSGKTRVVALNDGNGNQRILIIGLTKDNHATFKLPQTKHPFSSYAGRTTLGKDGRWTFTGKAFSCDLLQ